MNVKYTIDHIPNNSRKRPQYPLDWQYLTVHNTGNPDSTARNERGWLTNPSNKTSTGFHIVVDEREAIECIPLNEVGWHAGDGGQGPGNRQSIGIEICESGNQEKTMRNAVELVSKLLKSRNKGIETVKQHFDWSKKNCPRLLRANNGQEWQKFIADVKKELEEVEKCKVYLDGKYMGEGLLHEGRSYLPVRALENVKYTVERWDGNTKSVYLRSV